MVEIISLTKNRLFPFIKAFGDALIISIDAIFYGRKLWKRKNYFYREIINAGIKTFLIISIVALFTGMILALQSGLTLQQWSQEHRIGQILTLTLLREMSPFMTCLILSASIGSAYTAEIASMNISEELAALRIMGINPNDFVVMPKFFAIIVVAPILTIYSATIGIIGGFIVAYTKLNVGAEIYYKFVINSIFNKDIFVSLLKSCVFAFIIITISSYQGMSAKRGAIGVSKATRSSVILSFLAIIISGYFITSLFYT